MPVGLFLTFSLTFFLAFFALLLTSLGLFLALLLLFFAFTFTLFGLFLALFLTLLGELFAFFSLILASLFLSFLGVFLSLLSGFVGSPGRVFTPLVVEVTLFLFILLGLLDGVLFGDFGYTRQFALVLLLLLDAVFDLFLALGFSMMFVLMWTGVKIRLSM